MLIESPYGQWQSPITAEIVSAASKKNDFVEFDGQNVYWIEGRPQEKGRNVLMHYSPDGSVKELSSPNYNLRSSVHEYGGKPYIIDKGVIYFINYKDQALYCQKGEQVDRLTDGTIRLAEPIISPEGIIAVAEKHQSNTVDNFLALVNSKTGEIQPLATGQDFYGSPTLSHDGKQLAWISWNFPNMPWDGTELWIANLERNKLSDIRRIDGGNKESIFQPQWSPEGVLHYISDKSGWWNLYRHEYGQSTNIFPIEAEFGRPLWILGMSTWGFDGNTVIASYQKNGKWFLAKIAKDKKAESFPVNLTDIQSFRVNKGSAAFLASFADDSQKVVKMDLTSKKMNIIGGTSLDPTIENENYSKGEPIIFPSTGGRNAYAFYYPPKNQKYQATQNSKPPLLVRAHGGPTAQISGSFQWLIQYWTSRGFAVVDVNYGGSTGYGRDYRNLLKKNWGIVDKEDVEAAARYLASKGLADPNKMVIDGGSAGGYTALCALTFGDVFTAGASYYGVSDLTLLAKETHKFESHYLDELIGPYPAEKETYDKRSPLQQADRLKRPVIFFQGDEDKIVLPNQAETLYQELKKQGIKTELIIYPGEQHGFRNAKTIKDALEKELAFYLAIFNDT